MIPFSTKQQVLVAVCLLWQPVCQGFVVSPTTTPFQSQSTTRSSPILAAQNEEGSRSSSVSFEETDTASKGLVSSLTNLVNAVMPKDKEAAKVSTLDQSTAAATAFPPTSPQELLERIAKDYTQENYLWTGNIDFPCFDQECQFQDPTLSFTGRDQFVTNVQNLQPLLANPALQVNQTQSILLNITLHEEYVQTRWNMVGQFQGWLLFWKPQINVIGNTKFWFRPVQNNNNPQEKAPLAVYFYDEEWEMPAYQALWQLLTPGPRKEIAT